ncbi:LysR family transcriptional regulator [Oleomonas cavernae]|uniref:LysR family transcriptional regulator n=1 Tax=Oleomonas cavernae TaxID=2320859 RepID=A0A418VTQ0_9PROT|nr:LysR family transcriptional regulator [Oleomonas cavernae]RJF80525.1 LysR family transcriptional regulator [Oleomonas cavernae]
MDQLAAMRSFVRVVEAGTFTRAADLLEMPKPTVTKLIQGLEAHLNTKLLNRTTRSVTVTADGAAYYERVVRLLNDLDEIDGGMTVSQSKPKGKLRVDVPGSIAHLVIIPALPAFHAAYPEIQLDLGVSDRRADLLTENVDCVVRVGELSDTSLIARRVGEMTTVTCAAPAYIASHGAPTHPRDLEREHQVVGFFTARAGRSVPFNFVRGAERLEINGRCAVAVNEGKAYLLAGLVGLGVLQVPVFMARCYLKSGELVPVMPDWQSEAKPLHVVYPPNRHLSNKVRVFVDWVAGLFAREDFGSQRL